MTSPRSATLLRSVRDRDFDTLAALCGDDFGTVDVGIVDVDPSSNEKAIRTPNGWREPRRHAPVISSEVPAEMCASAGS